MPLRYPWEVCVCLVLYVCYYKVMYHQKIYITLFVLPGVTASGLFSQTSSVRPATLHKAKSSPDIMQPVHNNANSSSPLIDTGHDDSDIHQGVRIKENKNNLITYSGEKSYSQSEVQIVMERGTLHAFTVALALSVHSVFEGLAFGLQDTVNEVYCVCSVL